MAESSLSLGFPELRQAVGHYLGFGSTILSWTATQIAVIETVVQSGYRRVLYPPAVDASSVGYEWSFLRPTTTLDIETDNGDYDLPDDYGRIVGKFHYEADEHRAPVVGVSLAALLDMRSHSDLSSAPTFFATRYKSSDGTAGQKQEVLFFPEPDADYTLSYNFDAYTGKLTDATPYPLGGMAMAELYKESCLAVAESRNGDEIGLHNELFKAMLVDAIARDSKKSARNYGQMGQPDGVTGRREWRRGSSLEDGAYSIEYKGDFI